MRPRLTKAEIAALAPLRPWTLSFDLGNPGGSCLVRDRATRDDFPILPLMVAGMRASWNLADFSDWVREVIFTFRPKIVTAETAWTGRNDPRPGVGLAQSRKWGIVQEVVQEFNAGRPVKMRIRTVTYYASQIKAGMLNNGHAGKEDVIAWVERNFHWTLDEHRADAIMIASFAHLREGKPIPKGERRPQRRGGFRPRRRGW